MGSFLIQWSNKFELGIEEIDSQHKQLIDIINKLYKAFSKKQSVAMIGEILNELNMYAEIHFQTEEQLFNEWRFEGMLEHLQEHRFYERKIKEYEKLIDKNVNIDFSVLSFLKKWWTDHILIADRKYVN